MFRPKSRNRKRQAEKSACHKSSRRLFLESLETRRLLAGVVNVITVAPGDLTLDGDSSNNQVEVRAGSTTGQLIVTGKSGTLLQLDGSPQTFSTLTVNGIVDDLIVALEGGNDTFELGTATGSRTEIENNVTISNDDDDANFIRNADIGDNLTVDRAALGSAGSSDLTVQDTIIRGKTVIDNDGAGGLFDGDSKTIIERSELEETLSISNAAGDDTAIIANTSIGAALFVRPPAMKTDPIVHISNGLGSSFTSITSKNDPAATTPLPSGTLNRPTVYGSIEVTNGDPVPPGIVVAPPSGGGALPSGLITTVDIVVVNSADVLGELNVSNADGHSEVIVVDSKIGTDTKDAAAGGYGGPITVNNENGFDLFELNGSVAQYGVFVTNGAAGQNWGSDSLVADSKVGKRVTSGPAFSFKGDDGDDVFNINDSATGKTIIYAGGLSLDLLRGENEVSIVGVAGSNIELESLMITGGADDDAVVLRNAQVESMLSIELAAGVDRLELRVLAADLPNALIGAIKLDGGIGADFYTIPVGIPFANFETPIT